MKPYRNSRRDSGVVGYDYGRNWIRLQFAGGKIYKYTASRIGTSNLKAMKRLADARDGLTTFVNTHPEVKDGCGLHRDSSENPRRRESMER